MLRELLTGLAVVFMASSVIISSIFRSSKYDKRQLPVKNIIINNNNSTTAEPVPAPEAEPHGSDSSFEWMN
jgi:hypothetical protein